MCLALKGPQRYETTHQRRAFGTDAAEVHALSRRAFTRWHARSLVSAGAYRALQSTGRCGLDASPVLRKQVEAPSRASLGLSRSIVSRETVERCYSRAVLPSTRTGRPPRRQQQRHRGHSKQPFSLRAGLLGLVDMLAWAVSPKSVRVTPTRNGWHHRTTSRRVCYLIRWIVDCLEKAAQRAVRDEPGPACMKAVCSTKWSSVQRRRIRICRCPRGGTFGMSSDVRDCRATSASSMNGGHAARHISRSQHDARLTEYPFCR